MAALKLDRSVSAPVSSTTTANGNKPPLEEANGNNPPLEEATPTHPAGSPVDQAGETDEPVEREPVERAVSNRASVVLDPSGRRRICPDQLEADGASGQFVCPLCSFVLVKPLLTSCSHMFCEACFQGWVGKQVSKQKRDGGPVPLLPCPQPECNAKLRKRDIMPMDKADISKEGAAKVLLRLRNGLRIRCVHHSSHFDQPFGSDAKRISDETGLSCRWVGELAAYDEHVASCPIEKELAGSGAQPEVVQGAESSARTEDAQESPSAGTGDSDVGTENAAVPSVASQRPDAAEAEEITTAPTPIPTDIDDSGETRIARYDYIPSDTSKAQINIKADDLVKIFQVTETGWAAGVRLCRKTMQEVGEAGWFPAGYLYPPNHSAAKACSVKKG